MAADTHLEEGAVVQLDVGSEGVVPGGHTSAADCVQDLAEVTALGDARVSLASWCLESLQLLHLLHTHAHVRLREEGREERVKAGKDEFFI